MMHCDALHTIHWVSDKCEALCTKVVGFLIVLKCQSTQRSSWYDMAVFTCSIQYNPGAYRRDYLQPHDYSTKLRNATTKRPDVRTSNPLWNLPRNSPLPHHIFLSYHHMRRYIFYHWTLINNLIFMKIHSGRRLWWGSRPLDEKLQKSHNGSFSQFIDPKPDSYGDAFQDVVSVGIPQRLWQ